MVWVGECLRVRSCLYARVFVHELLYAYSACVSNNIWCMCLHVFRLSVWKLTYIFLDGGNVRFVLFRDLIPRRTVCKKKNISQNISLFSLTTVSANLLQSWRTSTLLKYWRAMSSSKPKRALNNWNKEMTCN